MKKTSKLIIILGGLLVAAVVLYFAYNFFIRKQVSQSQDLTPLNYVYLWNDDTYNNAQKLTNEGKYDEALDEYNKLLTTDLSKEDVITKSQINIRIATLLDLMGQKQAAVETLSKIASNPNEYFITRAFAYEYIARMLYDTRDPEVLKIIESVAGVTGGSNDKYTDVSIQLLNKSVEIAPLYLALTQKMKIELNSSNVPFTKDNTLKIRNELGTIDSMIKDIIDEQNVGYMLPLALLRKAQIAERIDESGNYGLPKSVEDYYKDAITAYEKYGEATSYNYVYYEYARYLANKFGETRKSDIESLVSHYRGEVKEKDNFKLFIKNIQDRKESGIQIKELNKLESIVKVEL